MRTVDCAHLVEKMFLPNAYENEKQLARLFPMYASFEKRKTVPYLGCMRYHTPWTTYHFRRRRTQKKKTWSAGNAINHGAEIGGVGTGELENWFRGCGIFCNRLLGSRFLVCFQHPPIRYAVVLLPLPQFRTISAPVQHVPVLTLEGFRQLSLSVHLIT